MDDDSGALENVSNTEGNGNIPNDAPKKAKKLGCKGCRALSRVLKELAALHGEVGACEFQAKLLDKLSTMFYISALCFQHHVRQLRGGCEASEVEKGKQDRAVLRRFASALGLPMPENSFMACVLRSTATSDPYADPGTLIPPWELYGPWTVACIISHYVLTHQHDGDGAASFLVAMTSKLSCIVSTMPSVLPDMLQVVHWLVQYVTKAAPSLEICGIETYVTTDTHIRTAVEVYLPTAWLLHLDVMQSKWRLYIAAVLRLCFFEYEGTGLIGSPHRLALDLLSTLLFSPTAVSERRWFHPIPLKQDAAGNAGTCQRLLLDLVLQATGGYSGAVAFGPILAGIVYVELLYYRETSAVRDEAGNTVSSDYPLERDEEWISPTLGRVVRSLGEALENPQPMPCEPEKSSDSATVEPSASPASPPGEEAPSALPTMSEILSNIRAVIVVLEPSCKEKKAWKDYSNTERLLCRHGDARISNLLLLPPPTAARFLQITLNVPVSADVVALLESIVATLATEGEFIDAAKGNGLVQAKLPAVLPAVLEEMSTFLRNDEVEAFTTNVSTLLGV